MNIFDVFLYPEGRCERTLSSPGAIFLGFTILTIAEAVRRIFVPLTGSGSILESSVSDSSGPGWVISFVTMLIYGTGIALTEQGCVGVQAWIRRLLLRRRYLGQPWLYDYRWDHSSVFDDNGFYFWRAFANVRFVALVSLPVNWFAYRAYAVHHEGYGFIIAGVLDILILKFIYEMFQYMRQWWKYGRSYLTFSRFPYFLGEALDVQMECPRGLGEVESVSAVLRCVQEEIRDKSVERFENFSSRVEHRFEQSTLNVRSVQLRFQLPPAWSLETRLSDRFPQYWELEVTTDAPGLDYQTSFLLPVYHKTGVVPGESLSPGAHRDIDRQLKEARAALSYVACPACRQSGLVPLLDKEAGYPTKDSSKFVAQCPKCGETHIISEADVLQARGILKPQTDDWDQ